MASHFEFKNFSSKYKLFGAIFVHFSATTLGPRHPLKKPLKTQNDQFQFNIQLLGDKMASHFEFQNFPIKNKLLGAILVHFFSPSVVATTLGARGPLEKAPKKANCPFSI